MKFKCTTACRIVTEEPTHIPVKHSFLITVFQEKTAIPSLSFLGNIKEEHGTAKLTISATRVEICFYQLSHGKRSQQLQ